MTPVERIVKVIMKPQGLDGQEEALTITVVEALENPLKANPGDTVIWSLDEEAATRGVRLKFQNIEPLPYDGTSEECEELGPFASLSHEAGRIVGTLRQDLELNRRFIYKFVAGENDEQVPWGNPLEGRQNFGGLDVPAPPPRG